MSTWATSKPLRKLNVIERPDPGADPDLFDGLVLGDPGQMGYPFYADIVQAGWLPKSFFDALAPGGGDSILAVTVSFVFVDPSTGTPTDLNNDQHLDTAFAEVYYNDNFGDPSGSRPPNPWGIGIALQGVDVETVALHESGHAFGVGRFGPPPVAVMNPVYGRGSGTSRCPPISPACRRISGAGRANEASQRATTSEGRSRGERPSSYRVQPVSCCSRPTRAAAPARGWR